MSYRTDPKLALALLINNDWNFDSKLPTAIDTAMYGWKTGANQKEVMIITDRRGHEKRIWPQVLVEDAEEFNKPAGNTQWVTALMVIDVAVPTVYPAPPNGKQPNVLVNYAYQMREHIREIVLGNSSTKLEAGDTVFSLNEDLRVSPTTKYGGEWYSHEVTFSMDYFE